MTQAPAPWFSRSKSFWYGLTLPWEAAKLILSKPSLMAWSALPVVLTTVIYIFLISWLQDQAAVAIEGLLMDWGFEAQSWGATFLKVMGYIVIWIVSALTFAFTATLVASPFNDFLAERAEQFVHPALPPVKETGWSATLKLMVIDLGKNIAAMGAGITALVFSWVPILNLIAFGLAFLLLTFQFVSYPQTRRGLGLKDGGRFLIRHAMACMGFGACLTFLFAIPIFSIVVLPIAVVGGTMLVARAPGNNELYVLK